MTLLLGSTQGADDLGRQRIRKDPTSDTLYVGWSSIGNHDGELNLADNAYITVLNEFRVWAKIPRITNNGTIYKDYDVTFEKDPPPVANAGIWLLDKVDPSTGKLRVYLSASNSFAVEGSISTYLWTLPSSGATIISGTVNSSSLTVDFEQCQYVVYLKANCTNGESHTCIKKIVAATDAMLIDDFTFNTYTVTPFGQNVEITVHTELDPDIYLDGTVFMIMEEEYYNSTGGTITGPSNYNHMRFIGWHDAESISIEAQRTGLKTGTKLTLLDIVGKMREIPSFPQIVISDSTADDWTEQANLNIDKYIKYLLYWHSTVLELTDFQWSGTGSTYVLTRLSSDGGGFYDQVNRRCNAIIHDLTCDSFNRLEMVPNPNRQDEADRTISVYEFIAETDYSDIKINKKRHPRVHWLRGASIVADSTQVKAAFCVAPGQAPGQGLNKTNTNEQLVEDQDELNIREGHHYADLNREVESVEITLSHSGYGGLEPAYRYWLKLTLNEHDARKVSFSNDKFLIEEVSIDVDPTLEGNNKKITLKLVPEVIGEPAVTEVRRRHTVDIPDISLPFDEFPKRKWNRPPLRKRYNFTHDQYGAMYFAVLATESAGSPDRYLWIFKTTDFWTPDYQGSPTWTVEYENIFLNAGGVIPKSFRIDPFSPYYLGTGTEINGVLNTKSGIYTLTDITGTPSLTSRQAHTYPNGHVEYSLRQDGHVYVFCGNHAGTGIDANKWLDIPIYFSNDHGVTWTLKSTQTINTETQTGTSQIAAIMPIIDNSANNTLYYIDRSVSASYVLYKSTDNGATFATSTDYDLSQSDGGTNQGLGNLYFQYGHPEYIYGNKQSGGAGLTYQFIDSNGDVVGYSGTNEANYPLVQSIDRVWDGRSLVGISPINPKKVVVYPNSNLAASADKQIIVSKDGGKTQVELTLDLGGDYPVTTYDGNIQMSNTKEDLFAVFPQLYSFSGSYAPIWISQDFETLENKSGNLAVIIDNASLNPILGNGQQLFGGPE
jgi:hypothetical protein